MSATTTLSHTGRGSETDLEQARRYVLEAQQSLKASPKDPNGYSPGDFLNLPRDWILARDILSARLTARKSDEAFAAMDRAMTSCPNCNCWRSGLSSPQP